MEKISAEKAVELLTKQGIVLTILEAEQLLAFMDMLAGIVVAQYLKNNNVVKHGR